jgi:hypothetical protein
MDGTISHPVDSKRPRCRDCEQLKAAILRLPAVREDIEAKARDIYSGDLAAHGRALDHWLAAEEEAGAWIEAAFICTSVSARMSADSI